MLRTSDYAETCKFTDLMTFYSQFWNELKTGKAGEFERSGLQKSEHMNHGTDRAVGSDVPGWRLHVRLALRVAVWPLRRPYVGCEAACSIWT